jgi:hypothetical protein
MTENPFEILRLDPSATEEEIVRQAGRLRQRATDEATRNAIRQAVQVLTARAEDRQRFALLTHPAPRHHWPALERFAAAFRRPPVATRSVEPCPPLDLEEFAGLLRVLVAEELELPSLSLEPMTAGEPPEEIERQTMEALWQSLLFDPGA